MKNKCDIDLLKNQHNQLFGNAYSYFINRLTDYHISKVDGKERVLQELQQWDEEARQIIVADLRANLTAQGLMSIVNNSLPASYQASSAVVILTL